VRELREILDVAREIVRLKRFSEQLSSGTMEPEGEREGGREEGRGPDGGGAWDQGGGGAGGGRSEAGTEEEEAGNDDEEEEEESYPSLQAAALLAAKREAKENETAQTEREEWEKELGGGEGGGEGLRLPAGLQYEVSLYLEEQRQLMRRLALDDWEVRQRFVEHETQRLHLRSRAEVAGKMQELKSLLARGETCPSLCANSPTNMGREISPSLCANSPTNSPTNSSLLMARIRPVSPAASVSASDPRTRGSGPGALEEAVIGIVEGPEVAGARGGWEEGAGEEAGASDGKSVARDTIPPPLSAEESQRLVLDTLLRPSNDADFLDFCDEFVKEGNGLEWGGGGGRRGAFVVQAADGASVRVLGAGIHTLSLSLTHTHTLSLSHTHTHTNTHIHTYRRGNKSGAQGFTKHCRQGRRLGGGKRAE
jgi:hypothetical protein